MVLQKELGGYSRSIIRLLGGFELGNPPTVFRDGTNVASASKMFSVSHLGTGHYKVQFSTTDKYPIPKLPFILPHIEQAAEPVAPCTVHVVKGSWDQSARSFELQVLTVGTTPAVSDGDAGDRITFEVIGSIDSVGTDPA